MVDPAARNEVTLVIDDGPTASTQALLSLLEEAGHRAVLFIVGHRLSGFEPLASGKAARRMRTLIQAVQGGFALGNHSYAHTQFSTISFKQARKSIERTDRLIDEIYADAGVRRPGKWFRFPYGDAGGECLHAFQDLLQDMGFERPPCLTRHIGEEERARLDWPTTLSTRDWELPSESEFRQRLRQARPGEVIEFHDFPHTIDRFGASIVEELSGLSLRATIPSALEDHS
jgi:peptidoglycan/xylan/chitin deacetylase (PgdA/CDA1 family)